MSCSRSDGPTCSLDWVLPLRAGDVDGCNPRPIRGVPGEATFSTVAPYDIFPLSIYKNQPKGD